MPTSSTPLHPGVENLGGIVAGIVNGSRDVNGSAAVKGKSVDLDRRDLVPPTGLRDFWYPAIQAKKIGKKPVRIKMLGEELCFFRGGDGQVAALSDICPHRGASLADGDCHYEGTVACPYHGWVFDAQGECLAVLSEGPQSKIPGKVKARTYPT